MKAVVGPAALALMALFHSPADAQQPAKQDPRLSAAYTFNTITNAVTTTPSGARARAS